MGAKCMPAQGMAADYLTEKFAKREQQQYGQMIRLNFDCEGHHPLRLFQENYTQNSSEFIDHQRAAAILLEFKRFLFLAWLCFEPGEKVPPLKANELVPSPVVDRFWRVVISNTNGYKKLNTRLFKKNFLHRESRDMCKVENYNKTLNLYKEYFGQPDNFLWPPYGSSDSLLHGHHGYLWLRVKEFQTFHFRFVKKTEGKKNTGDLQKLYTKEVVLLKQQSKCKIKETGQIQGLTASLIGSQAGSMINNDAPAKKSGDKPTKVKAAATMSLNLGVGRKKGLSSSFVGAGEKKKGGLLDDVQQDSDDDEPLEQKRKGGMGGSVLVSASMIQRFEKALGIKPDKVVIQQPKGGDDGDVNQDVGEFSDDEDEQDKEGEAKDIVELYLKPNYQESKFNLTSKFKLYKIPPVMMTNFKFELNTDSKLTWLIFEETKRFLLLLHLTKPSARLIPPPFVKLAWDYMVFETNRYQTFCQNVFNQFLNTTFIPENPIKADQKKYQLTIDLYRRVFAKEPNSEVWPRPALRFDPKSEFGARKFINIRGSMTEVINKIKPLSKRKDKSQLGAEKNHQIKAIKGIIHHIQAPAEKTAF